MGFNNDGAEVVARRLAERRVDRTGRRLGVPLGINIGKTKVVPEDDAIRDYEKSTTLLAPYADYLVVNVSSPNTPGLRDLQAVDRLEPLLRAVRRRADDVTDRHVPLLVKIAPDLSDEDVLAVADLAVGARPGRHRRHQHHDLPRRAAPRAPAQVEAAGAGGLSGPPLRARATEVLRLLRDRVGPDLTLIGVGGITTAEDAVERLDGRRRPAAGLHRVHLRGTVVARADQRRASPRVRATASGEPMTQHLRRPAARRDGRPRTAVRRDRPARRRCSTPGA